MAVRAPCCGNKKWNENWERNKNKEQEFQSIPLFVHTVAVNYYSTKKRPVVGNNSAAVTQLKN